MSGKRTPPSRARAPSSRGRPRSPPIYNINVYGNFTYVTNANSHNVATSTVTERTNDHSMIVLKAESITHSSSCGRHCSQSEPDPSSASGSDEDEGDRASLNSEASQECSNNTHVEAEVQTEPWGIDLNHFVSAGEKESSASATSQELTNHPYVEA